MESIENSDLVSLDAPILGHFNSMLKQTLPRLEYLERSKALVELEAPFDEVSIEIVFEEFSNFISKESKLFEENEAKNLIARLSAKLPTFQRVFKALSTPVASGENEEKVAFFVKPSEIIEKLLDFKNLHFSVSKQVDELIGNFYDIYIDSNIILNRNIDHLDFISERIVSEGFILRNSFVDFSNQEIVLEKEGLI